MAIGLTWIMRTRRALLIASGACAALGLPGSAAHAQRANSAAAPPAGAAAAADTQGAELALHALTLVGVPYRFGGDEPGRGFDCSGLVRHVARSVLGLDLPRTSEAIARVGQSVPRDALEGGDLVFFNTRGHRNSHVGVYVGEGRFVHAPARNGLVRVEAISDRYWHTRFTGGRRLHGAGGTGPGTRRALPPAPDRPAERPSDEPAAPHPASGA